MGRGSSTSGPFAYPTLSYLVNNHNVSSPSTRVDLRQTRACVRSFSIHSSTISFIVDRLSLLPAAAPAVLLPPCINRSSLVLHCFRHFALTVISLLTHPNRPHLVLLFDHTQASVVSYNPSPSSSKGLWDSHNRSRFILFNYWSSGGLIIALGRCHTYTDRIT